MTSAGQGAAWPRLRPAVLFLSLAAAAALADLGDLHRLEHGDSIVPVLVSLQRWTPFYWGQERFGMLLPLLALPVADPLANLLLQRGLMVLAGLGAVVLLARHVLAGRDWPLAGLAAAATLLAVAPRPWLFAYLGDQPYGLALALALAGLALAEGSPLGRRGAARLAAGLVLVVAAHWVNAATAVLLLPLALARAGADLLDGAGRGAVARRLAVDGSLLAAGLAAGQVLLRLYSETTGLRARTDLGALPLDRLPAAWATLFLNAWRDLAAWGLFAGGCAVAGVLLLSLRPLRAHRASALARAAAFLLAALAYALFAGSLRWVEANAFHPRYVAPAAVLVHLAAVSLLAEPLARLRRLAPPAAAVALAAVPAAALLVYSAPSLAGVRADLDAVAGRHTEDVLGAGCHVVAGDYWTVWPAVWHAAQVARDRGLDREVFGLAHRANPTTRFWSALPREELRVCRVVGEERHAERSLRDFGLWPVVELGRRGTVDLVAPAPAPTERATSGTRPGP